MKQYLWCPDSTPLLTPPLWWLLPLLISPICWLLPCADSTSLTTQPPWYCVSHPSWLRSVVETEYPNEDANSSPHRMNSGTRRYALSFLSSTTAPVWLARGAPATKVSSVCCITPLAESTAKPEHGSATLLESSQTLFNSCLTLMLIRIRIRIRIWSESTSALHLIMFHQLAVTSPILHLPNSC